MILLPFLTSQSELKLLPTSLYIHIPWCIRKCPYCDFNSHKSPKDLPEERYIDALLADFKADLSDLPAREIHTLFIGGGTPSLFSASAYEKLFNELQKLISFSKSIEISLEANPGTVEQSRFRGYRQLGFNRLSLGVQSFNSSHLITLGRIHNGDQAHRAIATARDAGFTNINIDLMYGLPEQSIGQGLADLETALGYQPEHLSWYQLTLEPNTLFYKQRPLLPNEEIIEQIEQQGLAILTEKGLNRYEISAFSRPGKIAKHNLNYWLFGDYYGIGAGAHSKITLEDGRVYRCHKRRQPLDYLALDKPYRANKEQLAVKRLIFEFMLNTTRLEQKIPHSLFAKRTKLPFACLKPGLLEAEGKGLVLIKKNFWQITPQGRRYTNDLQALFL